MHPEDDVLWYEKNPHKAHTKNMEKCSDAFSPSESTWPQTGVSDLVVEVGIVGLPPLVLVREVAHSGREPLPRRELLGGRERVAHVLVQARRDRLARLVLLGRRDDGAALQVGWGRA